MNYLFDDDLMEQGRPLPANEFGYPQLVSITHNPNTQLPYAHYTDKRFRHPQTVFGKGAKDLNYDYSDRLTEWDYDKSRQAAKVANESGATNRSQKWFEVYLTAYFGKPVELQHILTGYNWSTGYDYHVFGYKFK